MTHDTLSVSVLQSVMLVITYQLMLIENEADIIIPITNKLNTSEKHLIEIQKGHELSFFM